MIEDTLDKTKRLAKAITICKTNEQQATQQQLDEFESKNKANKISTVKDIITKTKDQNQNWMQKMWFKSQM